MYYYLKIGQLRRTFCTPYVCKAFQLHGCGYVISVHAEPCVVLILTQRNCQAQLVISVRKTAHNEQVSAIFLPDKAECYAP